MRKHFLLFLLIVVRNGAVLAISFQETNAKDQTNNSSSRSFIKTNGKYSAVMLSENTTNLNQKQLYLLQARQSGLITDGAFYIGARLVGLLDYQTANIPNRFGWLMRHPTSENQTGTHVSEAALHSAQLGLTGTILS